MALLSQTSSPTLLAALAAALALYAVSLVFYRLYFHPLKNIPGSRWAAITYWYESYYIIIKGGRYTPLYAQQHKDYDTPLLRINPDEVHISDPDYYDHIYSVGTKFDKSAMVYSQMGPESMFSVASLEKHRFHRDPLNPFFSRRNILELEPVVQDEIDRLNARLAGKAKTGEPLDAHFAMRAVAFDVVTNYCFEFSYDAINREDLGAPFVATVESLVAVWMTNVYVFGAPVVSWIMNLVPGWLLEKAGEGPSALERWLRMCDQHVRKIASLPEKELMKGERSSIFKELLDPTKPGPRPSVEYLTNEAFVLLTAGGETAGMAMCQAIFGVLNNPPVLRKLLAELLAAFPSRDSDMSFLKCETLPYLNAVIKEALRKSDGVSSRLPRVVPAGGTFYKDTFLPAGTRISMSHHVQHNDERIFPSPSSFRPERWLENPALEKYLVAFSKGSRNCLGKNLAMTEITLALANVFRRFELELFDVAERDMELDRIFFSGLHNPKTQRHLKVFVKERAI